VDVGALLNAEPARLCLFPLAPETPSAACVPEPEGGGKGRGMQFRALWALVANGLVTRGGLNRTRCVSGRSGAASAGRLHHLLAPSHEHAVGVKASTAQSRAARADRACIRSGSDYTSRKVPSRYSAGDLYMHALGHSPRHIDRNTLSPTVEGGAADRHLTRAANTCLSDGCAKRTHSGCIHIYIADHRPRFSGYLGHRGQRVCPRVAAPAGRGEPHSFW